MIELNRNAYFSSVVKNFTATAYLF